MTKAPPAKYQDGTYRDLRPDLLHVALLGRVVRIPCADGDEITGTLAGFQRPMVGMTVLWLSERVRGEDDVTIHILSTGDVIKVRWHE